VRFGMVGSRVRGTECGKGCAVWVGVGAARCAERAVRFGMVGIRVRGTECGKGGSVRYGWEEGEGMECGKGWAVQMVCGVRGAVRRTARTECALMCTSEHEGECRVRCAVRGVL
jgi:hypothetical protein